MRALLVAFFAATSVLAQVVIPGSGRECWYRESGSRNVYDLRPLQRETDYMVLGVQGDYSIAVCGASKTPGFCAAAGYGMCQYQKNEEWTFAASLGFWSGSQPRWEELPGDLGKKQGVQITFTNGDKCGENRRRTVVRFLCSPGQDPTFRVVKEDHVECDYEFEMDTAHACPHEMPQQPQVPKDYRAALEVTNARRNESYWLDEIWEESNQRLRWDQYIHPAGQATTLIQFDKHMRYSILNGTKCEAQPLSPTMLMWPSMFDLYLEHKHMLEYAGVHSQRGIPCDVYEGKWVWMHPYDGLVYEEEVAWYFARENMHVVENPSLIRRPVFAAIRSNRSHPSLTTNDFHYFTYMDLVTDLGHEYDRQMELHWSNNCPGGPAPPKRDEATFSKMASGAVTALSFFMLVFGGFLGLVARWYYLKRSPQLGIQTSPAASATDAAGIASYHS